MGVIGIIGYLLPPASPYSASPENSTSSGKNSLRTTTSNLRITTEVPTSISSVAPLDTQSGGNYDTRENNTRENTSRDTKREQLEQRAEKLIKYELELLERLSRAQGRFPSLSSENNGRVASVSSRSRSKGNFPSIFSEDLEYAELLEAADSPKRFSTAGHEYQMQVGLVVEDSLPLRSGPGMNYGRLTVLTKGAQVAIDYKRAGWYRIHSAEGIRAWVRSNAVAVIK